MTTADSRPTRLARFVGFIETAGNALPHPATLFAILALLVIVISGLAPWFDVTVTHL